MGDRYRDDGYGRPPSQSQHAPQYDQDRAYTPSQRQLSNGADSGYRPSSQRNYSNPYLPSNALQYGSSSYGQGSNTHLVPYAPGEYAPPSPRPGPSGSPEEDGHHRKHGSRPRHSRRSSAVDRRDRDDGKPDKKKEIAAALIGAAGGGLLGHEFGGSPIAAVLGAAAGAFAGDKFEKNREKKKLERSKSERRDSRREPRRGADGHAYDNDFGDQRRDMPGEKLYDSDDERRRHRSRRDDGSRSTRRRRHDSDDDDY